MMEALPTARCSEHKKENDHPDKDASAKYDEPDGNSCEHLRTRFLSVQQNPIWSVEMGAPQTMIRMQVGIPVDFCDPCASQGLCDIHVPNCGVVQPSVRSPGQVVLACFPPAIGFSGCCGLCLPACRLFLNQSKTLEFISDDQCRLGFHGSIFLPG